MRLFGLLNADSEEESSTATTLSEKTVLEQSRIIVQMFVDEMCEGEMVMIRAFAVPENGTCELTSDFENIRSYTANCQTQFKYRITMFNEPCVGQSLNVLQTKLTTSDCVKLTGTEKYVKALAMCAPNSASSIFSCATISLLVFSVLFSLLNVY